MKKLLIMLLLYAPIVFAQVSKDNSWTPPDEFMNGDTLSDTDIQRYHYACSNNGGATFDFYTADIPNAGGTTTFTTAAVFLPGNYRCFITVFAVHPTETIERESDPSNQVLFTVGQCQATDCRPGPAVLQIALVNRGHQISLSVQATDARAVVQYSNRG